MRDGPCARDTRQRARSTTRGARRASVRSRDPARVDRLRLRRHEGRAVRRDGRAAPALRVRADEARGRGVRPASGAGALHRAHELRLRRRRRLRERGRRASPQGESAGGIRDRTGSPTFVRHLADRLLPLLLTGRFGTYHLAGSEPACWFDVLERARAIGGLPGTVEPQEFASLGLVAPRPANSAMASAYLEHIGIEPLPGLDEAVAEWIGAAEDPG